VGAVVCCQPVLRYIDTTAAHSHADTLAPSKRTPGGRSDMFRPAGLRDCYSQGDRAMRCSSRDRFAYQAIVWSCRHWFGAGTLRTLLMAASSKIGRSGRVHNGH